MAGVFRDRRARKNGWRPWCIMYKGLDDKCRREVTQALTKEQAWGLLKKKLKDVEDARAKGLQRLEPPTLAEFLPIHLRHVEARCRPEQVTRVESTFRLYILPVLGGRRLDRISIGDVQDYVDGRLRATHCSKKKPFAPATIKLEKHALSALFKNAVKRNLVAGNPCKGVDLPVFCNVVERYLSVQEEELLLAASCHGLRVFIRMGLLTGMRKGELLGLQWGMVDLHRRMIRLPGSQTKSRKPRDIGINDELLEILVEVGPSLDPTQRVLLNPDTGAPWTSIEDLFDRAVGRSRILKCRIHDLRHTCASRMAQAGVSLGELRIFLGHGDIRTTMRYAHFQRDEAARANAVLSHWRDRNAETREVARQKGARESA